MKYGRFMATMAALFGAVILLSACAGGELLLQTAKQVGRELGGEAPPPGPPVPAGYKLGEPYMVSGVRYFPRFDPGYDETGIASWYGEPFHGRDTANGEPYDMNELTAAHKTMPMPSIARVTNLENGRSLTLRVNDRGPFVNGRIIDVSRRGAQLLGFYRKGTAKVRVEFVAFAPLTVMAKSTPEKGGGKGDASPRRRMSTEEVVRAQSEPVVERPPISSQYLDAPGGDDIEMGDIGNDALASLAEPANGNLLSGMFVQVGAFAERANALRLARRLSGMSPSVIAAANINGVTWFRVRMGPIAELGEADELLAKAIAAGYPDARLIVAR